MIAKIRRGADFRGLQRYLLSEAKGVPSQDIELRHVVSVGTAAAEMHLVASRSQRTQRAVYHVILAWAEEEQAGRDDQFAIGHELLDRIGLSAHQAMLVRHSEAKAGAVPGAGRHFELHLMINRVGPDGRAAAMRDDYAVVERAVADIAAARAMRVVPGRFNGQGEFVQGSSEQARSVASAMGRQSPAMELRAAPGAMAGLTEARAQGWTALVEAFARRGLAVAESDRTARAGQSAGLVLVDVADEKRREKISALDTPDLKWGRPTLERELGAFPVDLAATLCPAGRTSDRGSEIKVPRSSADRDRRAFAEARDHAIAERRHLSQAHAEAKRQLLDSQAREKKHRVSLMAERRNLVRNFFGRNSEVGRALNRVLDTGSAERLAVQKDAQRQDLQAMMGRHREDLARVPVPTWADWRRAGENRLTDSRAITPLHGPEPAQRGAADRVSVSTGEGRCTPDPSVVALAIETREQERRVERLRLDHERKARLRRGDLETRVTAIADDLCVAVAAEVIGHLRPRNALRTTVLIIAALASGSAIAPAVLAAAAVALLRRGDLKAERSRFRADVDASKAARTGWDLADAAAAERGSYAALARSGLIEPTGPDPGPIIAAIGQRRAAAFLAWWAYASPKQRAVVERWSKQRRIKRAARARSSHSIA